MSQNLNVTPDARIDPLFLRAFNYADKTTTLKLEDWVSILTLCFSPLIAHILAGVPTVVRRCPHPPNWLDTLCLYNPTTILWRYLAIAERRARYRHHWNAASMAASNALFWTSQGFDGSEEMMQQSQAFCTRIPHYHRTDLLSTDSVKTLITTLQGIQAFVVLIRGILALANIGNQPFNASIAMNSIFYPLAVFGLLRLFAAPWLTEDYTYAEHESYESSRILALGQHGLHHSPASTVVQGSHSENKHATSSGTPLLPMSSSSIRDPSLDAPPSVTGKTLVLSVRISYLFLICGILALCVCYMVPQNGLSTIPTQSPSVSVLWMLPIVYIVFSVLSIIIFLIYLVRCGGQTTTVIPCIHTWWYRAYTLGLMAAIIALIVLSGVYTRRTACGQLTVFPPEYDQQLCNGTPLRAHAGLGPFGILTQAPALTPQTWIMPLEGWCSGTLTGEIIPVVSVS
ncbi:uncharacterized protein BDW43DRAFT_323347 [Aspergillus alliaceus]|uniref:uncharacterized protein n=1 Tax=Petromyces alliaceus TaxID=209559 RepID=UPI0012A4B9CB|nr:uncharacterized protein BDW43DRAFT_323347 [Aspergillus alliaceus]KAB8228079.1 hypothetical protein BDW43DRAFT_323347 [Aspergillus alliaceus]